MISRITQLLKIKTVLSVTN